MFGAWKRWSGELALSSERDFERLALPFLRPIWPTMLQVPPKKGWDSKGIDLLVWAEGTSFPCAVQCKGFAVQEIGSDQTRQTCNSIEQFRASGVQVDTYLVIHNREGRNPDFRREVTTRLREIAASGQAKVAELWDRHRFLNRCRARLEELIELGLRGKAEDLLSYYNNLFLMGSAFLPEVPVSESRLRFRRFEPCTQIAVTKGSRSVSKLIVSPTEARWTLLTGTFGAGKTTSVLHAAASKETTPVLIECRLLPAQSDQLQGTSLLLEESLKALNIFDSFSDADRPILYEVAGTSFKTMLKRQDSKFLLILDGLDEHRFYSHYRGMEALSNQLAELNCPIVMTTRQEHLNTMFGDFSAAFEEFSVKYAPRRDARLLELEPWTIGQSIALSELVLANLVGRGRDNLRDFCELLRQNAFAGLYGDLPSNPLMLRFILDDVVDLGIRRTSRAVLLDSWIKRKIRRDRRSSSRTSLTDDLDLEDYVARVLKIMQDAAERMVSLSDGAAELSESISEREVREIATSVFDRPIESLLGLSLTSFLLPGGPILAGNRSFVFAFRIVQEYLLARHFWSAGTVPDRFPNTVQKLYEELATWAPENAAPLA